ncbi:MAG: hypothetical protein OEM94_08995 [Acidimicrobiia bacterium]|nr:hypothetical protein [Acidimicrobiia bacterium]
MPTKKNLLTYVVGYLTFGGLGMAIVPDQFLDLFQSNQEYGDVMPRVVGMFMITLAAFIAMTIYFEDYKYYPFSIAARTFIVLVLFAVYFIDRDPFFLVINAIVLVGLIPSYVVLARERRAQT